MLMLFKSKIAFIQQTASNDNDLTLFSLVIYRYQLYIQQLLT